MEDSVSPHSLIIVRGKYFSIDNGSPEGRRVLQPIANYLQSLHKEVPFRLEGRDYKELRQRVLRRDSWRCQLCGSMMNLGGHHQHFRSHLGEGIEENLITLCTNCHSWIHGTLELRIL